MTWRFPLLTLCAILVACNQQGQFVTEQGEPLKIDPTKPPDGTEMLQILLARQSLPLKQSGCGSGPDDKSRLQHLLAARLGEGIDDHRLRKTLSGGCKAAQFELRSGASIDAWHCGLNVVETNLDAMKKDSKGEYIIKSSIDFAVTKDTWEIIPEKLWCTP